MNDRIKLAEAMGWTHIHMKHVAMDGKSYPFGCVPGNVNDKHLKEQIPDPFTDANDDYAVLEWARKNLDHDAYFAALTEVVGSYCYLHEYRIGYFAVAALKTLAAKENDV